MDLKGEESFVQVFVIIYLTKVAGTKPSGPKRSAVACSDADPSSFFRIQTTKHWIGIQIQILQRSYEISQLS